MRILRCYEYDTLRIGQHYGEVRFTQADWHNIARWQQSQERTYCRILPDAVQWQQYVGLVQVEGLSVEILPKLDRDTAPQDALYDLLLPMLDRCRYVPVARARGQVGTQPGRLMALFVRAFVERVERMVRQGLLLSYRTEVGPSAALRGRLMLGQQLTRTDARFYTQRSAYRYAHPYYGIIRAALEALVGVEGVQRSVVRRLLAHFPAEKVGRGTQLPSVLDARFRPYQATFSMAQMILSQYRPGIGAGRLPFFSMLFDMNVLYEDYVYQLLAALDLPEITVTRRAVRPFWERTELQPDIVLQDGTDRYVLDTKWKLANPTTADLQQMYTYTRFYEAETAILLYPGAVTTTTVPSPYLDDSGVHCAVLRLPIVRNGRLNDGLGREILAYLRHRRP